MRRERIALARTLCYPSHMHITDQTLYERVRARLRSSDPAAVRDASILAERARALASAPAEAVTDKEPTPHSPSDDLHDYVSIATYYHPNPDTPDGLPYVSRDGVLSPDIERYDRPRWDRTASAIVTAARGAYFLGDETCARDAARRLRRWFVDGESRMNPHLVFAQFNPGESTGRCYGVIDFSLYLPAVLDHATLLEGIDGGTWTDTDARALRDWCGAFYEWLTHDPLALEEEATRNNHGVYYDRLAAHLARYLGDDDAARAHVERTRERIGSQIAPDGGMPHELRRTCSFGYSLMNTRGFVELARMGAALGLELWNHAPDEGGTIPAAVEFMYRHACSRDEWPHQQIEPIDWRMMCPVLRAANELSGDRYPVEAIAHRLPDGFDAEAFAMIEPMHPFGSERSR